MLAGKGWALDLAKKNKSVLITIHLFPQVKVYLFTGAKHHNRAKKEKILQRHTVCLNVKALHFYIFMGYLKKYFGIVLIKPFSLRSSYWNRFETDFCSTNMTIHISIYFTLLCSFVSPCSNIKTPWVSKQVPKDSVAPRWEKEKQTKKSRSKKLHRKKKHHQAVS